MPHPTHLVLRLEKVEICHLVNSPFMGKMVVYFAYILNGSGNCLILPVSWGTSSLATPQLFSHPHPRMTGWDVPLIGALGHWFTSHFAHRLLLWYCSCICMNPLHFCVTLSTAAMLLFVPVYNVWVELWPNSYQGAVADLEI